MTDIRKKINMGKIILLLLVITAVIIQAYPLFWIFMSSLKSSDEFMANPSYKLPEKVIFTNYIYVLTQTNIPKYFLNSVIVAFFTLIFQCFLGSLAGFALSKMTFRAKNFVFIFFMFGMMIPIFVGLIPIFRMYNVLGLRDTYASLIIPQVGFAIPISMYLFMGFMDFIPNEIQESAFMDGASPFKVYISIIMPMSANAIITVLTFNFISVWNEYTLATTFISATRMRTLPVGLTEFLRGMGTRDWGGIFASIGISILPTLIIYFLLNDKIIESMAAGAIKG
jgi:raffinose/stachyose/melibiose transport system permease protein